MADPTEPWSASGSRLILILSSIRSGSTLLRALLGAHSRIVAPSELFLLMYPDYRSWHADRPVAIESLLEYFRLLGLPRTPEEIHTAAAGLTIPEVYRWLFGFLAPGQALLDKTPAYASSVPTLRASAAFDPFYVWLIRHPLGTVDSFIRLRHQELPPWRRPLRRLKERLQEAVGAGMSGRARRREFLWLRQNRKVRDFLAGVPPGRKRVLLFENLVGHPREELGALCEGMGYRFEDALLGAAGSPVPHHRLGDPNFHRHTGISTAPARAWQARYREADLRPDTRRLLDELWRPALRSGP